MSCTDEAIHVSMGELKSMSPQAFGTTVPLLYQLLANTVRPTEEAALSNSSGFYTVDDGGNQT